MDTTVSDLSIAMKMKQHINNLIHTQNPIGTNVTHTLQVMANHYVDRDYNITDIPLTRIKPEYELEDYFDAIEQQFEPDVLKNQSDISKIANLCLSDSWYHDTQFNDFPITVHGEQYPLFFNQTTVEKWYSQGYEATFGDLNSMTTKIDPATRSARDITNIEVDDIVLKRIARSWSQHMSPPVVRVEPYKLNIYAPGDKFVEHLDSQLPDLVGTALYGIFDSNSKPTFEICTPDRSKTFKWKTNKLLMFYPDCPHQVLPGTGWRVTIAFRIFKKEDAPLALNNKIDGLLTNICNRTKAMAHQGLFENKFGICLSRGYGMTNNSHFGPDDKFLQAIGENKTYSIHDVIVRDNFSWYEEGGELCGDSNVFLVNEGTADIEGILFYDLSSGFLWSEKKEDFIEHTGNECREGSLDSIYISRAVIFTVK